MLSEQAEERTRLIFGSAKLVSAFEVSIWKEVSTLQQTTGVYGDAKLPESVGTGQAELNQSIWES